MKIFYGKFLNSGNEEEINTLLNSLTRSEIVYITVENGWLYLVYERDEVKVVN